jgi:hypothetical protein
MKTFILLMLAAMFVESCTLDFDSFRGGLPDAGKDLGTDGLATSRQTATGTGTQSSTGTSSQVATGTASRTSTGTGSQTATVCSAGSHDDGTGICAFNSVCAIGYLTNAAGTCVFSGCPSGYNHCSGKCLTGTCPGSVGLGGTCSSNQDCAPGYGCRGTTGGTVCSQNL